MVIADKIAEAQISGVIYEPVTPEKGNKMAENIRNKLSQQSRQPVDSPYSPPIEIKTPKASLFL